MLKVGLIGCGGMGSVHANCWLALSDKAQITAIADTVSEKAHEFADKVGAKVYTTGEELLRNEEIDLVDICLPTYLHTKHAIMAMKKGCSVFVEKPICLNEAEAQLLLATQKETGATVQVGQVIRFWDEYVWLKETVDSGIYGKVISGVFQRLSANPRWSWENWYNDYTKSGTMALDLHVHDIDFARYLMGEPDSISSHATRDKDGVIEQIFSTYSYGNAVITTEGCWDYPDNFPFSMTYRVKMEKATAVLDANGVLTVYLDNGEKIKPEIIKQFNAEEDCGINISNLGAYYNEIKYFIENVINGGKEIASLCEAIKSARMAWKEIELAGGAKR